MPVGAAIFASTIYESPAIVHYLDSYIRLGIEFELAFTIGKDIPEGTVFSKQCERVCRQCYASLRTDRRQGG